MQGARVHYLHILHYLSLVIHTLIPLALCMPLLQYVLCLYG